MENRIKDLFATIIKADLSAITDSTSPKNLEGWDSLQHMFLVSGFEEEFSIEIEPEETVEMYNDYGAFKKVIMDKIA